MDLSKLASDTQWIDIFVPGTGDKTGLRIEIHSRESDEIKRVQRGWQTKALRGGRNSLTAQQIEQQAIDILVAAVANWDWGDKANWDGKKLEYNPENVSKVFNDPRGAFIRDQVDEAFGNDAGFFGQSEKSSENS